MKAFQNKSKTKNIKFIKNSICLCCGKKLRKAINLANFNLTEFYICDSEKIKKNYEKNLHYSKELSILRK